MERIASLLSLSSLSSSRPSTNDRLESVLFLEDGPKRRPRRLRMLLGFYMYKRITLWIILSLMIVSVVLFKTSDTSAAHAVSGWLSESTSSAASLFADNVSIDEDGEEMDDFNDDDQEDDLLEMVVDELSAKQDAEDLKRAKEAIEKTPWLRFPHLNGYFNGLKTLVNISDHIPEYPNPAVQAPIAQPPPNAPVPKPQPYNPYHADPSRQTCYLDRDNTIAPPTLFAYQGVPQNMPDAVIGSHKLLGIRDDVCFDRFGRYGPYGLGYKKDVGGSDIGLDTESSDNGAVWAESGQIDYNQIDWHDVQQRCFTANKDRFAEPDSKTGPLNAVEGKKSRTAVVIRLYSGFEWTQLVILNFRALITEVSLHTGGEYEVHFLLHVRDDDAPIWADEDTVQNLLKSDVPPEFHGMVTLWSEAQMRMYYPGKFDDPLSNPSNSDVHGVYRSAHMPLQKFAVEHPEFEQFWNWELDIRFLGNWFEFFDRVGSWADKQPRELLWERNSRYYIPSHHGSWENFTVATKQETDKSKKKSIFGPVDYKGKKPLKSNNETRIMPNSCDEGGDKALCGVGEAADIITLNPIFDVDNSGWVFSNDVTGYNKEPSPPRRCAIVTASRMSRRLLMAMHEEVWRNHQTMFTEMFPPTVAFHHGFKAVYAPHPVFLERAWDPMGGSVSSAFNGGQFHSTSGSGSPFHLNNEHNHRGTTWYYNSEFSGLLWRRWLGYAQMDGRGKIGAKKDDGKLKGGKEAEEGEESSGRMCLRSMLLHPIKHEKPSEKK